MSSGCEVGYEFRKRFSVTLDLRNLKISCSSFSVSLHSFDTRLIAEAYLVIFDKSRERLLFCSSFWNVVDLRCYLVAFHDEN